MPDSNDKEVKLEQLLNQVETMKSEPERFMIQAEILEALAKSKKSNPILETSIRAYKEVLIRGREASDELFRKAADKCIELMKFRGWNTQAIRIWQMLIRRFDQDLELRHQLGVTYLTVGNNQAAKEVFEDLLKVDPEDYYANAHIGFILKSEALESKNDDKLKEAVRFIEKGIKNEPKEEGRKKLEGLFYFHLGDSLRRLGNDTHADEIYQIAADRGRFPSFWQRSLYNEPDLKAQPVWSLKESGIEAQLQKIKENWKAIRDEALKVYDDKNGGFLHESENLQDTGYWAQFDLFIQGRRKNAHCAKAPLTCALIEAIPEVKSNRRGQVKFSVMKSGTHVHAHSGPTNCRLRAHLGKKFIVFEIQCSF